MHPACHRALEKIFSTIFQKYDSFGATRNGLLFSRRRRTYIRVPKTDLLVGYLDFLCCSRGTAILGFSDFLLTENGCVRVDSNATIGSKAALGSRRALGSNGFNRECFEDDLVDSHLWRQKRFRRPKHTCVRAWHQKAKMAKSNSRVLGRGWRFGDTSRLWAVQCVCDCI